MAGAEHHGGTPAAGGGGEHRRERLLHVALLLVLPALVFANTLGNAYHLDDFPRIVNNPEVERVLPLGRHFVDPRTSSVIPQVVQYRPLLPLSLSVNRALGRALGLDDLTAYHLGNVATHLVAVLLLYLLLGELLGNWAGHDPRAAWRLAAGAALLFGVHPVSGVPVTYLCARDLLLMQAFLLAYLLVHASMRRRVPYWWGLLIPLPLLALSLLSKTNAAIAPLLLVFFELTLGGARPRDVAPYARALPALALSVGFFAFTRRVLGFSDAAMLTVERAPLEYPLSQLALHVTVYLRNLIWPFHLRPLPRLEPVTSLANVWSWIGLGLIVASVVIAWRLRARRPEVAFALAAYWTLFVPTSSVLPFRLLATDYRAYPSLPWAALLAVLLLGALTVARLRRLAFAALLLWLAVTAVGMNRTWRTGETLWGHSVRLGGATMAHHNHAMALLGVDEPRAERHFRKALELEPNNVRSSISLGMLLLRAGRTAEGLAEVRRARDRAPSWALTHHWLAEALTAVGRLEEAAASSARAATMDPRNPRYLYKAAWDAQAVGDHESSLPFLEQLHALRPSHQLSLFLEGFARQRSGRPEQAVPIYRRFLDEQPEHVQARFNLGHALTELGRCEEAVPELERVLQLRSEYAEAHLHLARCLTAIGRSDEAAEHAGAWERSRR